MANRIGVILLGHELDTHGDESIQVNSKMKDLTDIAKVFTDVSTSFSLPASKRNNKVFQHYWRFSIQEVNVLNRPIIDYRLKQVCNLEVDGVPYKEGMLQLTSITMRDGKPQDYNCSWIGHTATLSDRFGTDLISELDWIEFNHEVGASTYVAAGLSTAVPQLFDDKVIYPLVTDNKDEWTKARLQAGTASTEFSPAMRVDQIFERIQSKYDMTFNMPMLAEDRIQKLYMWLPNSLTDDDLDPLTGFRGTRIDMQSFNPTGAPAKRFVNLDEDYIRSAFLTQQGDYPDGYRFVLTFVPDAADATKEYTVRMYEADPVIHYFTEVDPGQAFTGTGNNSITFNLDGSHVGKIIRFYVKTTLTGDSIKYDNDINVFTVEYVSGSPPDILTFVTKILTVDGNIYNPKDDISRAFPELQVIDFMAAFIKMFNLVIEPVSNNEFNIMPYDEWKAQGKLVDLSEYGDISEYTVYPAALPKAFVFEYEDPEAANNHKFKELTSEAYGDEHLSTVGEAEEYSIKPKKFENLLWDRLDGTDEYYVGKAIAYGTEQSVTELTPAIDNIYLMYWGRNATASIKITGTPDNTITGYKMCDSYYPTVTPQHTLNFGGEINAYTTIAAPNNVSLVSQYYDKTLAKILSPHSRLYDFKFIFSFSKTQVLKLNDTIKVGDNYFDINEIDSNLLTGEVNIKAVNNVRAVLVVPPPSDTEPPQIGVLEVIGNISGTPPNVGNLAVIDHGPTFIELNLGYHTGSNTLTSLHLFQDGVDIQTLSPAASVYTVTGLTPNTTYNFYTILHDDQGLTDQSNTATRKTDPPALRPFTVSPIGHMDPADACTDPHTIDMYHDGDNSYPYLGDRIYITNDINDPLDGNDLWYRVSLGEVVKVNSLGAVTFVDTSTC